MTLSRERPCGKERRQARREAGRWRVSTFAYLRSTSDPTLPAIAVEDSAALAGVALAAARS